MRRYRKFITSSTGFSFLVVGVTGVIFKLFFKNHLLEEIHGWLGMVMVIAAILHIYQNWVSIRAYLRDKKVLMLIIPVVAIVLAITFKPEDEERKKNVNPREVVGKLTSASVHDVAVVFGKNPMAVVQAMNKDGLNGASETATLKDIAAQNKKDPEEQRGADKLLVYFVK